MQVQTSKEFYFSFFYSKSQGCWFESRHSKAIKFCLHEYEIFPHLFSSKDLRTCPTMVKVTTKYSTQKRRLGFAALYIVTLCLYRSRQTLFCTVLHSETGMDVQTFCRTGLQTGTGFSVISCWQTCCVEFRQTS